MTVILVDGKNALYRFGWVHKNLKAEDGTQTGATYGIINLLLRLKKKYPDARFVICWDELGYRSNGWRVKLYAEYKQRDGEMSAETRNILAQEDTVVETINRLGIYQSRVKDMEGDDLIGLMAWQCRRWNLETVIYGSDRDFWQLMPEGVQVIRDVNKKARLAPETEEAIRKDYYCKAVDVCKVKAFVGDKSDKIPSLLRGVGPARAAKLVEEGVDPSEEEAPEWLKARYPTVYKMWPQVHRNYRLVRIPTSYKDVEFDDPTCRRLGKELLQLRGYLKAAQDFMNDIMYRELVEWLGGLGLLRAMENRQELVRLGTLMIF
jgi:DNA polymerase I